MMLQIIVFHGISFGLRDLWIAGLIALTGIIAGGAIFFTALMPWRPL